MSPAKSAKPSPPSAFAGSRATPRALAKNPNGLATLREAARRAFVERGYYAVSIRDLAREAGLSMSVLYHYYASKQELLYGVLNDAIDSFHEILQQHTPEQDADPVERFLVLIESMVEYRAKLRIDSLLFIREIRNLEPEYAQKLAARQSDVVELFDAVIAEGVESGDFATPYPADARRTLVATLNTIPEWYKPSGHLSVSALAARYSRIALAIVEYTGDLTRLRSA